MNQKIPYEELLRRFEELSHQYDDAHETLHAIQTGQVDALVVQSHEGPRLYTLKSADHSYRVFIEKMKEGAVTLDRDGQILYSNSQFAAMVRCSISEVIGYPFRRFVA